MDADRWKTLNELFEAALARDAAERIHFLREACAGDQTLLEDASRLLRAHERAPAALATSVFAAAVRTLATVDETPAGGRFGPYRVIHELGRGGMGVVYLGERADQQYEKRVAIKLMKRGIDTDAVLGLFRHERQVLAGLDHPNITRLLDGGTADDGRPFFVMEYVEGQPIHDYCDAHALSITERLQLFRSVCAAVSYAHRHLVVHRDLKPSNILVTTSGEPKLLDFGIAKLVDADRDGVVTMLAGVRVMTPAYASPEQLEGSPVTTLSDVYSLGVVLYELLTGRRPFTGTRTTHDATGMSAGEGAVTRPSSVVARGSSGASDLSPVQIAAARGMTPDRLRRRLRGDLDNLVLKAIQNERGRRYGSVEQLSEDIRRHLEGLPVAARPDTVAYRGWKFIRRNRAAVAAAALVVVSLVGGLVATAWQAQRAQTAQARAERRFKDVRKLAHSVLFDYHDAIQNLPGATRVRETLVKDARAYLDGLAVEAGDDAALQRELAVAYDRVADVLGKSYGANLGDRQGAMESYEKALRIRQALVASDPRDARNLRDLAESHRRIGWQFLGTHETGAGLEHVRRAVAIYVKLAAEQPADVELRRGLARAYNELGAALEDRGDLAGALENLRRAAGLLEELSRANPGDPRFRRSVSITYENMARSQFLTGDVAAALALNGKALQLREMLAAEDPGNADRRRLLAISYQNDGDFREQSGDRRGALESFRRKAAIDEDLLAADPANAQAHGDLAYSLQRLGDMLSHSGENSEALAHYRKSEELFSKSSPTSPDDSGLRLRIALSRAGAARSEASLGQRSAALGRNRQTVALLEKTADDPASADQRGLRAQVYTYLGETYVRLATSRHSPPVEPREHWSAAREMFRRSFAIWEDMRSRGILSVTDAKKRADAARELARCSHILRESDKSRATAMHLSRRRPQ